MKVLVYTGKVTTKGGITSASSTLIKALNAVGVKTTTDPDDYYDIADINFFQGAKKIIKKCRKKGIPVVVHAHSSEADFKYSFRFWQLAGRLWFYPSMWYMYEHADFVIPVSTFCKHHIESRLLHRGIPMQVINNAVDIETFERDENKIRRFYETFNLTKQDKIVLGMGVQINRKGIKDFIEVAKAMPDVKFIWFGGQSRLLTEPNVTKALKNKSDNVILPGWVEGDVLLGGLQAANCVFFPTYCENDSMVVLETLASKTPLLVRDIGAMEYLRDSVECYKEESNEYFVNALRFILDEPDMYAPIAEQGYDYVMKNRNLKQIGWKVKSIYSMLLHKNSADDKHY